MKILIIDDEKNICSAIKGILEDEGYECNYSLNYSDGFHKLQENRFDVLFLDIWLPDIDGIEGLKEIKRHFPEIEVIMISGHGTIETAVDTIRYGAYDFLEKPLSLERLASLAPYRQFHLRIILHYLLVQIYLFFFLQNQYMHLFLSQKAHFLLIQ